MAAKGLMGIMASLALATSTASAAPAVVGTDLNLRAGQGVDHRVIGVMPQGSIVDVAGCGDGWCYVRNYDGYASGRYLDIDRSPYAHAPPTRLQGYAVRAPTAVYGPTLSFGIGSPTYHAWDAPWVW
jgi:hypothetical protein